ncbi:MAG: periplasmic heavy metal sensor [Hyphomicrobiales bacterium]
MTADLSPVSARRPWLPQLRSRWWTLLLGLSLMANLLVGGMALGNFFFDGPSERLMGASYIQLIPRKFLFDLPRERRHQLMDIVHARGDDLRRLRDASRQSPTQLADALVKEPYDAAQVKAAIEAFTTGSESLAAGGGAVVEQIVAMLTPEERQQLAEAIRDRASRMERRGRK